jgi:hypothetical protein
LRRRIWSLITPGLGLYRPAILAGVPFPPQPLLALQRNRQSSSAKAKIVVRLNHSTTEMT